MADNYHFSVIARQLAVALSYLNKLKSWIYTDLSWDSQDALDKAVDLIGESLAIAAGHTDMNKVSADEIPVEAFNNMVTTEHIGCMIKGHQPVRATMNGYEVEDLPVTL